MENDNDSGIHTEFPSCVAFNLQFPTETGNTTTPVTTHTVGDVVERITGRPEEATAVIVTLLIIDRLPTEDVEMYWSPLMVKDRVTEEAER